MRVEYRVPALETVVWGNLKASGVFAIKNTNGRSFFLIPVSNQSTTRTDHNFPPLSFGTIIKG